MDHRRLDSMGAIMDGVLLRRPPATDEPSDRERLDPREDGENYDYKPMEADRIAALLDDGRLLYIPEYYGCVSAWKTSDGVYRGTLMQYRKAVNECSACQAVQSCS